MLKIENVDVVGWYHAIRGMRNPMNSHNRMDSFCDICCDECCIKGGEDIDWLSYDDDPCDYCEEMNGIGNIIGPNDRKLMTSLAKGGPVHAKYRRMIVVYMDVTAPLYWWKEFDTYKVGTVANSCSTMHKIHAKEFTLDDFSHEHLTKGNVELLEDTIISLNDARAYYLKWDGIAERYRENFDPKIHDKKDIWWQMIQLLPSSYNQKRTVMLNYEVLHNIYFSRKDHKLDEWHTFCDWIETLPHSEIITTPMKNSNIEIEDAIKVLQDAGFTVVKEDKAEDIFEENEVFDITLHEFCIGCKYTLNTSLKELVTVCGMCSRNMSGEYKHRGTDNYTPQEETK